MVTLLNKIVTCFYNTISTFDVHFRHMKDIRSNKFFSRLTIFLHFTRACKFARQQVIRYIDIANKVKQTCTFAFISFVLFILSTSVVEFGNTTVLGSIVLSANYKCALQGTITSICCLKRTIFGFEC